MNAKGTSGTPPFNLSFTHLQRVHEVTLQLLQLLSSEASEKNLLQKSVETMTTLLQARYGALGLVDETGKLMQFVYSGVAPELVERIGHLPEGRGLLGIVLHEDQVLRLDDMKQDPRFVGFPPYHPPMKSLLVTPITFEGRVYARLYLSEKMDGSVFNEQDEQLIKHFASVFALILTHHRSQCERRQQQAVIQGSEEDFRRLAENAHDGIVLANGNDAKPVFANQRLLDMLGCGLDEFLASPAATFLSPPRHQESMNKYRNTLNGSLQPHQYESELIRQDGTILPVEFSVAKTLWQGQPALLGIIRDITERKQTEQALHESEERFRQVVENAPVCIHTIDLHGRVTSMNRAGLRMLGAEKEAQVCGMEMLTTVSEPDRARIHAHMDEAFQGNSSEFEFTTVNGKIFISSFIPVKAAAGQIQYLLGVTEDVTQRKMAEASLHSSLEGLHALHAIISNSRSSFDEKIRALLTMGCQRFGLPIGIFAHIEGEHYEVREVIAPDNAIAQGSIFQLGKTYCSETLKTPEPVSFEHAAESEWKFHPCYAEFKLEAYLAIAIYVAGKPYGTINFSSPTPRQLSFTDTDKEILKSMAQWIGSELERRQAEAVSTRLGRILDSSSNEIYIFNADTLHFVQVNQGAQRNLGYTLEELRELTPLALKPEFTQQRFEALIAPLRREEQDTITFVTLHKRKDGSLYPVEVRLHLSRTEDPPVFVAVIQDITERRQTEERLHYLAHYDALTDLPNRVLLHKRLNEAMLEADRRERLVAVMFLDLDRFKTINDTLGHDVGDALLKAVAERLKKTVRPGDTISRLGGDEFTVILGNVAHVDDVSRVAQKILDQFLSPFRLGGRDLHTSPSIGITLYPLDDKAPEDLLKDADVAMYRAKELGRNRFQFFTADLNVRAARRLELETGLRQALERQEFILHYQPLVDTKTGRIKGMEALLRWQHPEFGLIPPLEFIPLAEDTGLIIQIGEWVLKTACAQIKAWHETGFPALQVAVNLSSKQLRDKNLVGVVQQALADSGLEARYLGLELTESVLMEDMELAAAIMKELKKVGVAFSLDDFGTGYSSLSYLKRFPIDYLKIDRSFVCDITTDLFGAGIVRAIIVMAHTLKIKVIAEGVETNEQLVFLRRQGCDITQGYYCSEPLPAELFTDLLRDWRRIRLEKCLATTKKTKKTRKR